MAKYNKVIQDSTYSVANDINKEIGAQNPGFKPVTHDSTYSICEEILEELKKGPKITVAPLNVTENGTYTAPENEAYSPVTVDVKPPLERRGHVFLENGEMNFTPTDGYYGIGSLDIKVKVPQPKPVIKPIDITLNGTYNVPQGTDGFNPINVNVPGGAGKFVVPNGMKFSYSESLPFDDLDFSQVTDMAGMFKYTKLSEIPLIDTSSVTIMQHTFEGSRELTTVPLFDTSNVTDMIGMFYGCKKLTTVPLFDTSNANQLDAMFRGCEILTTVPLFDTSKATSLSSMFYGCKNLTTVPLFDTSNATNLSGMFGYCDKLTTVPLFDTSNATSLNGMFQDCKNLTTIPQLDTSKCDNVSDMFSYCVSLTSLPLLDFTHVFYINWILTKCENLTDVGGFKNLRTSCTSGFLEYSNNITHESLMNVINNLGTPADIQQLKFGQVNLDKLTPDEIAIATAKNWELIA